VPNDARRGACGAYAPGVLPRVLVVDRSPTTRDQLAELLGPLVSEVAWATREAAPDRLRAAVTAGQGFEVVVLEADPALTPATVRDLAAFGGGARVVLVASGGDGIALAARCGASDVVMRPLSAAELAFRIGRGPAADARGDKRRPRKTDILIGTGSWIKELYDRIAMVAATDVTVAIFGESGTGKELVARTIHNASPRHDAPFVVVNCAAIPEALLEDELFGHVRGAFTDATRDREGLLAAAHTGTLFLDEIGELPLPLQGKLLRFVQERQFERVGGRETLTADVRLVAATNRDLAEMVSASQFRSDLYFRLRVIEIEIPPLRARGGDDIADLAAHFVDQFARRYRKGPLRLVDAAIPALVGYAWPGNVRELENTIERAVVMGHGPTIGVKDLALERRSRETEERRSGVFESPAWSSTAIPAQGGDVPRTESADDSIRLPDNLELAEAERRYARAILERCDGNQSAAARLLGISRNKLARLLKA